MSKLRVGTAVHTADAAGGEDANTRHRGHDHRRGHGGGAVGTEGQQPRQVAPAGLGHRRTAARQRLQLGRMQPGLQAPAQHGNGCRHGPMAAQLGLQQLPRVQVVRPGHAVGDQGRLQRHHRGADGQRRGHLGVQVEEGLRVQGRQPGQATLRQRPPGRSSSPPPTIASSQDLNGMPALRSRKNSGPVNTVW